MKPKAIIRSVSGVAASNSGSGLRIEVESAFADRIGFCAEWSVCGGETGDGKDAQMLGATDPAEAPRAGGQLAMAAETCANAGNIEKGIEIALDEQLTRRELSRP